MGSPKGLNLCAMTCLVPGSGADERLTSLLLPAKGTVAQLALGRDHCPMPLPEVLLGTCAQPQFSLCPNSGPYRGVRWQQCGAKAGKEKPGGPREPGIRDPSQGGKEVVRDRPLVSEAPNPQCLLHGPIKPHLGNLIPKMTLLRMVKLFLNLSHSITNNS